MTDPQQDLRTDEYRKALANMTAERDYLALRLDTLARDIIAIDLAPGAREQEEAKRRVNVFAADWLAQEDK